MWKKLTSVVLEHDPLDPVGAFVAVQLCGEDDDDVIVVVSVVGEIRLIVLRVTAPESKGFEHYCS